MSSAPHLSHKLPWNQLMEFLLDYKDPGIEQPVGSCGQIHLDKKKTQIQLDYRTYLQDQVCNISESECPTTGTKIFRKSQALQSTKDLFTARSHRKKDWNDIENPKPQHFLNCWRSTIEEFATTERAKVKVRKLRDPSETTQVWQNLITEGKVKQPEPYHYYNDCNCFLFTTLIELGDTYTLLSFPNSVIEEVLRCQHGGQAVGNNIRFLAYHVIRVYFYTNLIVCAELTQNPETWGPMKEGDYFRKTLMYNCDGQTFLEFSRKYLSPNMFMKDWDGMKELLKNCFKFIYFLHMLRKEIGIDSDDLTDFGLEHLYKC